MNLEKQVIKQKEKTIKILIKFLLYMHFLFNIQTASSCMIDN